MIYVNAIDDVVEKAGCERSGQQASLEKKIAAVCVCSSLKTRDDVKWLGSDPGTPSSGS
ncbi:hypothetical protein T06_15535 [Trichinella sp. T6]|uniref:Uncharacterized protein n=1 Tax=Trichinella murrelli TaxID=144512 RepID=A0A0V0UBS5_9BILA|nr:hypothetical protein T05_12028 [Trichinella murrelli]KRX77005.1 hypothetical protein T06_15535 [Trichinella sp. T6]KRZ91180.1 hypothetical protein T08_628 [Trichinella sp. T8]